MPNTIAALLLAFTASIQVSSAPLVRPVETVAATATSEISALFELHGPRVYRRALRMLGNAADAQDATQEIFIKVMRGSDGFRGQAQLSTWLYQVTTNHCLNVMRDRNRRNVLFDAQVAPVLKDDEVDPARAEDVATLRRLLRDGDERQATAAIYVYLDGMSHEEAAEVMGVSKRTVGNLLERFTEWARNQVDGKEGVS